MSTSLLNRFNAEKLWLGLEESRDITTRGIYDWTGSFYEYGSFPVLPPHPWRSPAFPTNSDGFRAGAIEWIGFGLAASLAKHKIYDPRLVEAGASQGLWCLPWIRCLARLSPKLTNIHAIAYEASPSIASAVDFWLTQDLSILKKNYQDFSFTLDGEFWCFEWKQQAIGAQSGIAHFPRVDCRSNNGSQISVNLTDSHDHSQVEVAIAALEDVTSMHSSLSMLHIDIQGAEKDLLLTSTLSSALKNVGILVLGTHSHEIHDLARQEISKCGFTLLAEEPCVYSQGGLVQDGEQLWASPQAAQDCKSMGLITLNI